MTKKYTRKERIVTVRVDTDTHARLQRIARLERRSVSGQSALFLAQAVGQCGTADAGDLSETQKETGKNEG